MPEEANAYDMGYEAGHAAGRVATIEGEFIEWYSSMLDDGPEAEKVCVDAKCGHIVLWSEHLKAGRQPAAFVDLGPVLHLWSGQGATLGPDLVDELAAALTAWAARKRAGVTAKAAGTGQEVAGR